MCRDVGSGIRRRCVMGGGLGGSAWIREEQPKKMARTLSRLAEACHEDAFSIRLRTLDLIVVFSRDVEGAVCSVLHAVCCHFPNLSTHGISAEDSTFNMRLHYSKVANCVNTIGVVFQRLYVSHFSRLLPSLSVQSGEHMQTPHAIPCARISDHMATWRDYLAYRCTP